MTADSFAEHDPYDDTPPVERDMKASIADYYRRKAAAKQAEAS